MACQKLMPLFFSYKYDLFIYYFFKNNNNTKIIGSTYYQAASFLGLTSVQLTILKMKREVTELAVPDNFRHEKNFTFNYISVF